MSIGLVQPEGLLWYTAGVPRCILFLSITVVFLQACVGAAYPAAELAQPSQSVHTAMPSATATDRVTVNQSAATEDAPSPTEELASATPRIATNTAVPTDNACMQRNGKVEEHELTTELLPDPLIYRIYLPPCYYVETKQSYPVLYLIHGQTFSEDQWDRLGVPETADRLIRKRITVPFIVVMPRDRVWWEPTDDNFGLAVEQSLVPWVDEHYRTIPDREYRAIGGLSRGGAWAAHIGLSHPDLFGAVGIHSGFIFATDLQDVNAWLNNTPEGLLPRIYMDISDRDAPEISTSAIWLEELLTSNAVPHEWHMFVGEHMEAYWAQHVEDYLRWYTQDWGK